MNIKSILSNKWLWIAGAGVAGLIVFLKMRGSSSDSGVTVTTSFTPASVGANELVSANKYRVIERRSGMSYVEVKSGSLGGTLEFSSPKSGKFTWNVISEGGKIYAEIA